MLLPLLSWALFAHYGAVQARPFAAEDLVELRRLGGSTVTPDGRWLAYALEEPDLAADTIRSDLWLLDLSDPSAAPSRWTQTPREDERAPAFSADGTAIYYLSDRSGSVQLWMRGLADGEPIQVTDLAAAVAGYAIAPGGGRIAIWYDEDAQCAAVACPDAPAQPAEGSARRFDSLFVRHWDRWADGTRSRLAVFALENGVASGEAVLVSPPGGGVVPTRPFGGGDQVAWHPSGQSLFFVMREAGTGEARSTDLDIYSASPDGSTPPVVLTADNDGLDTLPTPSPDGRYLAYVAIREPGYESGRRVLMVRDLGTDEVRPITAAWDRSVLSIAWSPDLRYLWLTAEERLDTALFRLTLADGTLARISGPGDIASALPLADGAVLVARSNALEPTDLFMIGPEGGMRRITHVNADLLAGLEMPEASRFTFTGAGRRRVHGMVYRPPGLAEGQRAPVALLVHGGPQGSFGDSWSYRWNPAAMAARGIAVVTIDFRGSLGYGEDFTDGVAGEWGGAPFEDLRRGLEAAILENRWIDGERACALGASYGGYMMFWIEGNWPGRFDCLVSHAGIFDTRMFYYETDELWFPEHDFGGPHFGNERAYERWNPVNHVGRWRTPMLLTHGEQDFRVAYTQSLAAFTALQRRGIPSRLLLYPDEGHWILGPRNALDWHREVYAWLDRWFFDGTNADNMD